MENRLFKILVLAAFTAQPVLAQTLVPATSEDLMDFDRRVSEQLNKSGAAKQQPSNFGSQVREEAKKLKDAGPDQGKEFGKWVSGERKKADNGRPSTAGGGAGSVGQSAGHGNAGSKGPPDGKGKKK